MLTQHQSDDKPIAAPRRFLIDVDETIRCVGRAPCPIARADQVLLLAPVLSTSYPHNSCRLVLEQEDTDGDFQISITDSGPKSVCRLARSAK